MHLIVCIMGILVVAAIMYMLFWGGGMDHFSATDKPHEIILYYSPNCGHCSAFMGTWSTFQNIINGDKNLPVHASKVNCNSDKDKCTEISGFPTVKLHKSNGTIFEFSDSRTVDSLLSFVRSKL